MEETSLYRQIADSVHRQISRGELKPGDRLPSIREMMKSWGCTIGTVQNAYQELSRQGWIVSRPGQATQVADTLPIQNSDLLRWAVLVHHAEAFLLDEITAGYQPSEVEEALHQAVERWNGTASSIPDHLSKPSIPPQSPGRDLSTTNKGSRDNTTFEEINDTHHASLSK